MKKKKTKKLVIAKETVRSLEAATLTKVAAGSPTDQFWSCRVCFEDPTIQISTCTC